MKYAIPSSAPPPWRSAGFPGPRGGRRQSTSLVSSTPYLFSYRHQRHMVVTADGRYHLLTNLGTQGGRRPACISCPPMTG
jgi:hypothetical protein